MKLVLIAAFLVTITTMGCQKKNDTTTNSNTANPIPAVSADCGAQKCI